MFNAKFKEVVSNEGVVSLVSCADNEAHVVNTWNSYLVIPDEERILIPAYGMRKTESNVNSNNNVLLTLGSKEVEGRMGQGTGFLIKGTARYIDSGPEYDMMKEKFSFVTRVVEVTVTSVKQTI